MSNTTNPDLPLILMYHSVERAVLPPMYRHHYVTAHEFHWQMGS